MKVCLSHESVPLGSCLSSLSPRTGHLLPNLPTQPTTSGTSSATAHVISDPSYRTHHSDLGQSDRKCWPSSGRFHDSSSANGSCNYGVVEPELDLRGLPDVHGRTHRLERLVVHYASVCDRWHKVPAPHRRFISSISSLLTGSCFIPSAPTEVCEQVHLHMANKVRWGKSGFRKCSKKKK